MNRTASVGVLVLVISVAAFIWGNNYLQKHQFDQIASFFTGQTDQLRTIAGFSVLGGIVAFIVGIIVLIVGLARGSKEN